MLRYSFETLNQLTFFFVQQVNEGNYMKAISIFDKVIFFMYSTEFLLLFVSPFYFLLRGCLVKMNGSICLPF